MTLDEQRGFIARWNAAAIERGRAEVEAHERRAARAREIQTKTGGPGARPGPPGEPTMWPVRSNAGMTIPERSDN